jgi:hypothetical protein
MGVTRRMTALTKISPRRPNQLLNGSDSHTPMTAAERKMTELIAPTFHGSEPVGDAIPNSVGKDRFAALEPVWSHPCTLSVCEYRYQRGSQADEDVRSSHGTDDDAEPEPKAALERVRTLNAQRLLLLGRDLVDAVGQAGLARHKRRARKQRLVLAEPALGAERLDVREQLCLAHPLWRTRQPPRRTHHAAQPRTLSGFSTMFEATAAWRSLPSSLYVGASCFSL